MKHLLGGLVAIAGFVLLSGCGTTKAKVPDAAATAPPAEVIHESNAGVARVDHPGQFPLVTAARYDSAPSLTTTGVVTAMYRAMCR
jgi:hypothetical protein